MQLTERQWEFVEPYLPIGEYGPYPERLRQQFEGVIWRFRTGGQWREMPREFGAWSTVQLKVDRSTIAVHDRDEAVKLSHGPARSADRGGAGQDRPGRSSRSVGAPR